jgi:hypothetical protein
MSESGNVPGKYFLEGAPELDRVGRQKVDARAPAHATDPSAQAGVGMTRGEMRWRVMHSLPKRHENHIFEAIRKRCAEYLTRQRFVITEGELVSQVWIKLMAGVSVPSDE